MQEFECYDSAIQTGGGVIDAFLSAFGSYKSRGEKVICRHLGIERVDPRPEAFYPVTKFLGAMAELQEQFGAGFMRKIGAFIFEKAVFPPGIDSAEKGLSVVNQAYYMNHRNADGKIGGYHWQAGAAGGTMLCDNPYPCAFDMGILETIARRFEPAAAVMHEPNEPCRHEGGEHCSYSVRW
jgi:hypothetical protein